MVFERRWKNDIFTAPEITSLKDLAHIVPTKGGQKFYLEGDFSTRASQ